MTNKRVIWRLLALLLAFGLIAAACGSDDDGGEDTATEEDAPAEEAPPEEEAPAEEAAGDLTPVKLQLQWVTQAQFAGYLAAVELGFYEDVGLDVEILQGGVDIVPATVLDSGAADFAISWVPRGLVPREEGLNITNISQVFQRSGTLQVAFADSGIESVTDLAGKNVGNWGFGNEFELLAGLRANDLDPDADVTLVQQAFDMAALLNGDIDAAQAMIYNEYAQVLETVNPDTGELYQPEDLNVIDWNDVGTAMLQDAIWADLDRLEEDPAYRDTAVRFVEGSLRGWIHCRDNPQACVDIIVAAGPPFGGPSHQAWMMNEINALIWPSPAPGVGTLDAELWVQTIDVALSEGILGAAPDDGAAQFDINEEALLNLQAAGLDVIGADFTKGTVEIQEGGN